MDYRKLSRVADSVKKWLFPSKYRRAAEIIEKYTKEGVEIGPDPRVRDGYFCFDSENFGEGTLNEGYREELEKAGYFYVDSYNVHDSLIEYWEK